MSRLRVALIGCGARGRQHLACLAGFADVEIVALADPSPAALEAASVLLARSPAVFSDAVSLLDRVPVDAAVVVAPAHLNAIVALPVLVH